MNDKISYVGITYPKIFNNKLVHKLWKRFMCRDGKHLFDEVWCPDDHYLYCDACGFVVHVKHFETWKLG